MADQEKLGDAVLFLSTDARKLIAGLDAAKAQAKGAGAEFSTLQSGLEEKFSRKFEHVGIKIFGHQMLNMIGIAGESRPILSLLELSTNSLAGAFGFAAGPIGIVTFALGAIAAIGFKVFESHKKHVETLDELVKKQQEEDNTLINLRDRIKDYEQSIRILNPTLENLKEKTRELLEVQSGKASQIDGLVITNAHKQIAANNLEISSLSEKTRKLKDWLPVQSDNAKAYNDGQSAIRKNVDSIQSLMDANELFRQKIRTTNLDISSRKKGFKDLNDEMERAVRIVNTSIQVGSKWAASENKKIDASVKWKQHFIKAQDDAEVKTRAFYGLQATETEDWEGVQKNAINTVSSTFANAFANMLVSGQSFTEAFTNAFKAMATSIIADIAQIIIKYQIMMMMTGGTGMAASAGGGLLSSLAGSFGAKASGGPVSSGVPVLVGERGPEIFTPHGDGVITPNNKIGSAGGVTINQNFSFSGMDFGSGQAARRIAQQIAAQLRAGATEALTMARAVTDNSTLQSGRAY